MTRGQGGVAQVLDGTNPSPVGSPAVRDVDIVSSAPALGEKTHQSTIVPPSPIASNRNGYVQSALTKYKDRLLSERPSPLHRIHKFRDGAAGSNSVASIG